MVRITRIFYCPKCGERVDKNSVEIRGGKVWCLMCGVNLSDLDGDYN